MTKLECYQKAINEIDDFFEYRYEGFSLNEIRGRVYKILDKLLENLKTTR